jgi:hypothetical protein
MKIYLSNLPVPKVQAVATPAAHGRGTLLLPLCQSNITALHLLHIRQPSRPTRAITQMCASSAA